MGIHPFHIALPAYDLEEAREFYSGVFGLIERRSAFNWVDFDFFGHQLSVHLVNQKFLRPESTSIDGDLVPAHHFGMILPQTDWEKLRDLIESKKQRFVIGPKLRFAGTANEQGTMFIVDPAGNYLEFKYFSKTKDGAWF